MSAHSSFTGVLKAVPCSLFFSLKTALLDGQPSRADGGGPTWGARRPTASGRAPHTFPLWSLDLWPFCSFAEALGALAGGQQVSTLYPFAGNPVMPRDSWCHPAFGPSSCATRHPSPTSRRPSEPLGLAAPPVLKGHFVKVFGFFFTSFQSLFPEEGPFCTGLIFAALQWNSLFLIFDQNIPSLLVTAMRSFHSSFCRLLAHVFYGY